MLPPLRERSPGGNGTYPTGTVGTEGAGSAIQASELVEPVAPNRRTRALLWPALFADGTTDIFFDDEDEELRSYSNRTKGAIEDFVGVPLAWQPLSLRLKPLTGGSSWVRWKCVGGGNTPTCEMYC